MQLDLHQIRNRKLIRANVTLRGSQNFLVNYNNDNMYFDESTNNKFNNNMFLLLIVRNLLLLSLIQRPMTKYNNNRKRINKLQNKIKYETKTKKKRKGRHAQEGKLIISIFHLTSLK